MSNYNFSISQIPGHTHSHFCRGCCRFFARLSSFSTTAKVAPPLFHSAHPAPSSLVLALSLSSNPFILQGQRFPQTRFTRHSRQIHCAARLPLWHIYLPVRRNKRRGLVWRHRRSHRCRYFWRDHSPPQAIQSRRAV